MRVWFAKKLQPRGVVGDGSGVGLADRVPNGPIGAWVWRLLADAGQLSLVWTQMGLEKGQDVIATSSVSQCWNEGAEN